MVSVSNLKQIHDSSSRHETEIKKSKNCGCFYCLSIFPPSEIIEWIDEPKDSSHGFGRTAICPKCDIDSVIPVSTSQETTKELLKKMQCYWF